ncbi:MOSC domain-containing protein [Litchfieldia alkalitelluris]|uniref:MOSC domain-containing protein n=1 Tax=Litchfieldia alkalitelluris TaxID=304268 RepID=UPI000996EB96|nr:MOSC domain-containing protein [Litchfieldia alkalitelluris]
MEKKKIITLSKGLPVKKEYQGKGYKSGIWKESANELSIKFQGILGDDVANHENHGGMERVVCYYPFEHYDFWEREFGQILSQAAFGENITGLNMQENEVCIGDIFEVGESVLQITQGRYPCGTINKRNENSLLLKRIFETGYTGYFFRVLQEGKVTMDSKINLLTPHPKKVTVSSIHHLYFHNSSPSLEEIENVLEIEELGQQWRSLLNTMRQKIQEGKN